MKLNFNRREREVKEITESSGMRRREFLNGFLAAAALGAVALISKKVDAQPAIRIQDYRLTKSLADIRNSTNGMTIRKGENKDDHSSEFEVTISQDMGSESITFSPKINGENSSFMHIISGSDNVTVPFSLNELMSEARKVLSSGMAKYEVLFERNEKDNSVICYLIPSKADGSEVKIKGKPLAFVSIYKFGDGIANRTEGTGTYYLVEPR